MGHIARDRHTTATAAETAAATGLTVRMERGSPEGNATVANLNVNQFLFCPLLLLYGPKVVRRAASKMVGPTLID